MKKLFIIICVISCLAVLSRCAVENLEPEIDYQIIEIENTTSEKDEITETKEEEYSFEYSDIHFTHSPSEVVKVNITYPQFKDEKLSTLNSKIEEFAKTNFKEIISDEDVDNLELTLEENYSVKLANDSIVSISSTGELTKKDAAYPSVIRSTLNIDPIDYRKLKISELINVDENFVELFKKNSNTNEQLAAYLTSFSNDEIKEKILNSKMYFTDKEIVIVFSVPHAIGDYIEVVFAKNTVESYL